MVPATEFSPRRDDVSVGSDSNDAEGISSSPAQPLHNFITGHPFANPRFNQPFQSKRLERDEQFCLYILCLYGFS
jgi:hypothetical protein